MLFKEFTYLGGVISSENCPQKDIAARAAKARTVFIRLQPIWKSSQDSLRTKVRIYSGNVTSVRLYCSEC